MLGAGYIAAVGECFSDARSVRHTINWSEPVYCEGKSVAVLFPNIKCPPAYDQPTNTFLPGWGKHERLVQERDAFTNTKSRRAMSRVSALNHAIDRMPNDQELLGLHRLGALLNRLVMAGNNESVSCVVTSPYEPDDRQADKYRQPKVFGVQKLGADQWEWHQLDFSNNRAKRTEYHNVSCFSAAAAQIAQHCGIEKVELDNNDLNKVRLPRSSEIAESLRIPGLPKVKLKIVAGKDARC